MEPDRLAELRQQLEQVDEALGDLVVDALRDAVRAGASRRPPAERLATRARTAVVRAGSLLRQAEEAARATTDVGDVQRFDGSVVGVEDSGSDDAGFERTEFEGAGFDGTGFEGTGFEGLAGRRPLRSRRALRPSEPTGDTLFDPDV